MHQEKNRDLRYIILEGAAASSLQPRVYNAHESPLDVLYKRQRIDDVQHEAGLLFRHDFEKCGFHGVRGIDISSERVDGRGPAGIHDHQHNRRDRLFRISKSLGRRSFGMLVNVCALGYGLNEVEKRCALPRSSGLPLLQDGLERLAEHYRLTAPQKGVYQGADWLSGRDDGQNNINK